MTSAETTAPVGVPASAAARDDAPASLPVRLLGHVPELDGIRGIAVLMTVAAHSFFAAAPGGGVTGVAVFFVLSGFLITTLLVQEADRTGDISLRRFYARRFLRLMPALWALLAVYVALALVAFNPVGLGDRARSAFFVATYFGNWQNAMGNNLTELSHTWSLAVEDQFYFVWPVALAIMLRRGWSRSRIVLAVAVALVVLATWRTVLFLAAAEWHRIYYGTDTVGASLVIGCLAGLAFSWNGAPQRIPWARAVALGSFALLIGCVAVVNQHVTVGQAFLATVGFPLIAVSSATLILAVATDRTAAPFLGHPILTYFGRISYALYLWHLLMIQFLGKVYHLPSLDRSILSIPIAIALATVSYYLIERRFLRLKRHFEPSSTQEADARAEPATAQAPKAPGPASAP